MCVYTIRRTTLLENQKIWELIDFWIENIIWNCIEVWMETNFKFDHHYKPSALLHKCLSCVLKWYLISGWLHSMPLYLYLILTQYSFIIDFPETHTITKLNYGFLSHQILSFPLSCHWIMRVQMVCLSLTRRSVKYWSRVQTFLWRSRYVFFHFFYNCFKLHTQKINNFDPLHDSLPLGEELIKIDEMIFFYFIFLVK